MAVMQTNELFKQQLSSKGHQLTDEELIGVKQVVFEIMCDVLDICEDLNIPYMLGGGTALGAVRHQGFIPWDDDIDLNIERQYIDRLLDEVERRFDDKYFVEAPVRTPGYLSSFIQIHKKGTIFQEYLVKQGDENGIKIDIFVIENTYNNAIRRKWHGFCCELGLLVLSCYRMFLWREEFVALADGNKKALLAIRIKGLLGAFIAPTGKYWFKRVQRCLSRCKDGKSEYVVIPSGRNHFFGEMYNRESFLQTVPMKFENMELNVTKDYDFYLSNLYGNYMELPPESSREHHVIYQLKL